MDRALGVKVPSFCFEGYLVVSGVFLWIEGMIFLQMGALTLHSLKIFFLDDYGMSEAGTIAILLIVAGATLIIGSFLSNLVLMYPSMHLYALLALLYGILLIFETIVSIYGVYYLPALGTAMTKAIYTIMINYNAGNYLNAGLNVIQQQLQCCGSDGYSSWFKTTWSVGKERVPDSCCKNLEACHNLEPLILADIYTKGCFQVIESLILISNSLFLGTLIGNILFLFVSIASAIKMGQRYKSVFEIDSVVPINA